MAEAGNQGQAGARKPARPLKIVTASIGVGLAWAALHVPADFAQAGPVALSQFALNAVTAILVAMSALKIGAAVVGFAASLLQPLVARMRR